MSKKNSSRKSSNSGSASRIVKSRMEERKNLSQFSNKVTRMKAEIAKTERQIGQCNIDKLNLMKDNAFYETEFSRTCKFKEKIDQTKDKFINILETLPQVHKKAKILNVEINFINHELKPKPVLDPKYVNKCKDYIEILEDLDRTPFLDRNQLKELSQICPLTEVNLSRKHKEEQPKQKRKLYQSFKTTRRIQRPFKFDNVYNNVRNINGILCRVLARLMNSCVCVNVSTTLDETEYTIKPQAHSKYIKFESKKMLETSEVHKPQLMIGNPSGHFSLDFYPLVRNLEDINIDQEIDRLYFQCSNNEEIPGVISLKAAKTLEEAKEKKSEYVVKLKGSFMFSQDRNNIYMTVRADDINDEETMFSVVDLDKMQAGKLQKVTKHLFRLPSTQLSVSSKFMKAEIRHSLSNKMLEGDKFKRHTVDGIVLMKSLIHKRLRLAERPLTDLTYFIEEELFLQKQTGAKLNIIEGRGEYRLELIKDTEMIYENNFTQSISRVDEYESINVSTEQHHEESKVELHQSNKTMSKLASSARGSDYGQFLVPSIIPQLNQRGFRKRSSFSGPPPSSRSGSKRGSMESLSSQEIAVFSSQKNIL